MGVGYYLGIALLVFTGIAIGLLKLDNFMGKYTEERTKHPREKFFVKKKMF